MYEYLCGICTTTLETGCKITYVHNEPVSPSYFALLGKPQLCHTRKSSSTLNSTINYFQNTSSETVLQGEVGQGSLQLASWCV